MEDNSSTQAEYNEYEEFAEVPFRSPQHRCLLQFSPFRGLDGEKSPTNNNGRFCRVLTEISGLNTPARLSTLQSNELSQFNSLDSNCSSASVPAVQVCPRPIRRRMRFFRGDGKHQNKSVESVEPTAVAQDQNSEKGPQTKTPSQFTIYGARSPKKKYLGSANVPRAENSHSKECKENKTPLHLGHESTAHVQHYASEPLPANGEGGISKASNKLLSGQSQGSPQPAKAKSHPTKEPSKLSAPGNTLRFRSKRKVGKTLESFSIIKRLSLNKIISSKSMNDTNNFNPDNSQYATPKDGRGEVEELSSGSTREMKRGFTTFGKSDNGSPSRKNPLRIFWRRSSKERIPHETGSSQRYIQDSEECAFSITCLNRVAESRSASDITKLRQARVELPVSDYCESGYRAGSSLPTITIRQSMYPADSTQELSSEQLGANMHPWKELTKQSVELEEYLDKVASP